MAKVKIELVRDYAGAGRRGDLVEVGAERAERWCREGIAVLPSTAAPKSSAKSKKEAAGPVTPQASTADGGGGAQAESKGGK